MELTSLSEWVKGIGWAFLGIIIVKIYLIPPGDFKIWKWINENLRDVILGLLIAIALLRIGDAGIEFLADKLSFEIPEGIDIHAVMILVSGYIQKKLHENHKVRKPIKKTE